MLNKELTITNIIQLTVPANATLNEKHVYLGNSSRQGGTGVERVHVSPFKRMTRVCPEAGSAISFIF